MARATKIAAVALLGAVGAAVLAVTAVSPSVPRADTPPAMAERHPVGRQAVPGHCRSATGPDARCAAAWEAERRRFFGTRE